MTLYQIFYILRSYFCSAVKLVLLASSYAFILRNSCEESGEFSVVKHNYVLPGTNMSTLYNQTYHSCLYSCISDVSCKSFNIQNKIPSECQLNNASAEENGTEISLTRKDGWTYYSTSYDDPNASKFSVRNHVETSVDR